MWKFNLVKLKKKSSGTNILTVSKNVPTLSAFHEAVNNSIPYAKKKVSRHVKSTATTKIIFLRFCRSKYRVVKYSRSDLA